MALQLLLVKIIDLYSMVLIVRVLISWVNPDPYNPIIQFLYRITDPLLNKIKEIMPDTWMIDFSPMIALLLLQVVKGLIFSL